ncbi:unnamed protein product [Choristocarpus tenellus]
MVGGGYQLRGPSADIPIPAPGGSLPGQPMNINQILEDRQRQDEKRRVKRAANRKSASMSRSRKKALVDDMMARNERMKQRALILTALPDLIMAIYRSGEISYVSPACNWLLLHTVNEVKGANLFDLVTADSHPTLRKIIADNLSRPLASKIEEGVGTDLTNKSLPDSKAKSSIPAEQGSCDMEQSGSRDAKLLPPPPPQVATSLTLRKNTDSGCNSQPAVSVSQKIGKGELKLKPPEECRTASLLECTAPNLLLPSNREQEQGHEGQHHNRKGSIHLRRSECSNSLCLIRCDKTTVWCESRISVRKAKGEGINASLAEIIFALRPMSEGDKVGQENGLAGALLVSQGSAPIPTNNPTLAGLGKEPEQGGWNDEDEEDGYCEEDCSNHSENDSSSNGGSSNGSSNDEKGEAQKTQSGTDAAEGGMPSSDTVSTVPSSSDGEHQCKKSSVNCPSTLQQRKHLKRKHVYMSQAAEDKSPSPDGRSNGGDMECEVSGSTSHEENSGSGTGGDSYGDSSINGGNRSGDEGGSEDGSTDGSSNGSRGRREDDVQNAVESLILMGNVYSNEKQ